MYKRKANELIDAIKSAHPKCAVSINPTKPRAKSFEVSILVADKAKKAEAVPVWSGVKKGPPRTLKFPEHSVILQSINELL